jgi:hypothetical protein
VARCCRCCIWDDASQSSLVSPACTDVPLLYQDYFRPPGSSANGSSIQHNKSTSRQSYPLHAAPTQLTQSALVYAGHRWAAVMLQCSHQPAAAGGAGGGLQRPWQHSR